MSTRFGEAAPVPKPEAAAGLQLVGGISADEYLILQLY